MDAHIRLSANTTQHNTRVAPALHLAFTALEAALAQAGNTPALVCLGASISQRQRIPPTNSWAEIAAVLLNVLAGSKLEG